MKKYLMALDAGTGSVRSVIFDTEGNQVEVSSREWEHKKDPRFEGSMDFDCANNWRLTIETIRESMEKANVNADDILAVATTSMREGIVLLDNDNREIWACANVDARANNEVAALNRIKDDLEQHIYQLSGQTFALGALCRILWVKENQPDIYEKTKSIIMLNDWLVLKLTGKLSSEPSNGCTTGIFDIQKREWDEEILKMCGLRSDILPPVYECSDVVGNVSIECADETGLSTNTQVVIGGGDAQLGALGVGLVYDNQTAVFGGSFWQLEYNTKDVKFDSKGRIRINCHTVKNMWNYEAIAFYPGLVMRWYRDAFCQLEKEREKETKVEVYAQMDSEASKIPAGSYGMMGLFSNVMDYMAWRHASPTLTGFDIDSEKYNRYTFYRAIMESAAYVTRGHKELIEEITGTEIKEITFANGASKSALWCQIVADVLNVTVKVPKVKEATALGAAICASVGAGVYNNMEEAAKELVQFENTFYPIDENVLEYSKMYKKFQKVYESQLDLADKGITKHMWIAPGLS